MPVTPIKLRVAADYSSSGIWLVEPWGELEPGMLAHEHLNLDPQLASKFDAWIELYALRLRDDASFDTHTFNITGRSLAAELRQFLGSRAEVVYLPESADGGVGVEESPEGD